MSAAFVLFLVAAGAASWVAWPPRDRSRDSDPALATKIDALVRSEERLLELAPRLRLLERSVMNLQLPDRFAEELFASRILVADHLSPTDVVERREFPSAGARLELFECSGTRPARTKSPAHLIPSLFKDVDYFDFASFTFHDGDHDPDGRFRTILGLHATARLLDGSLRWLKTKHEIVWRREAGRDGPEAWRIEEWRVRDWRQVDARYRMFEESLNRAVLDERALARARDSVHERHLLAAARDPSFRPPHPAFQVHSQDRHPGLVAADVDGDGWDDLYVMDQWGPNLLLRNRGDGRFTEEAERFGLDLADHSTSAVFADFDNDGDLDAFLGRSLAESRYLSRDGQRYVDRTSERIAGPLPMLVSSVSAVDFDRDGLLDVYFATYAAEAIQRELDARPGFFQRIADSAGLSAKTLLSAYLSASDSAELVRRAAASKEFTGRVGPPNRLFRNLGGGKFAPVEGGPLASWRNTYQAGWSDVDDDGDPDLYLANDYGPNQLLLNDGQGGFRDATDEFGVADIGFGMGVSFGDYDADGAMDLYVSNMYSKAGRRITGKLSDAINPSFAAMARGNSLFRGRTGRFEKVSGAEPPAIAVEEAGWSWGSQFVDVDNDGWLDIVALSGYYTPPAEIAADVDL